MASKIMIIRHAEKPKCLVRGVTEDGSPEPNDLAVRGWQRAGALVRFFAPTNGEFAHPGLAKPDAIYAKAATKYAPSVRAEHTVLLLARAFGKKINLKYSKGEEEGLVKAVLGMAGVVLIAWDHKTILDIAHLLASDVKTIPGSWPETRFDLVWLLDREAGAKVWRFSQIPQLLLPGEHADTISPASDRSA